MTNGTLRKRPSVETWVTRYLTCLACATLCLTGNAQANPLKHMHEATLNLTVQQQVQSRTKAEHRDLIQMHVAALNSLGRSEEALQKLDVAEAALPDAERNAELRVKVLLPLGRCDEAMPQLQAAIERREAMARQVLGPAFQAGGLLVTGAEELLAQAYCHTLQRRFDAAAASFARVIDPMDPTLMHYRAAWYEALRKLGAGPQTSLDTAAQHLPKQAGVHDLGLAVVTGRMPVQQALSELQRRRLRPTEVQDAQAEVLFFAAVAADSSQARAPLLTQLEALSPFGSTEWIMAKRLFGSP